MIEFKVVLFTISIFTKMTRVESVSTWIRHFCLDPELRKFSAGSGSGINHSGTTTLLKSDIYWLHFNLYLHVWIRIRIRNMDPIRITGYLREGVGEGNG